MPADQLKMHKMASKDIETMTGVCRKCGPVKLCRVSKDYRCESQSRETPTERLQNHIMVSKDIISMTGVCRKCGPVALYKKTNSKYYCETQERHLRSVHLLKRYGLSETEFDQMAIEQDGLCSICRKKPTLLHVDHVGDKVRGLLCGNCNRGIGLFYDSTDNLQAAIAYLERA